VSKSGEDETGRKRTCRFAGIVTIAFSSISASYVISPL
jgi:hypothetical protein